MATNTITQDGHTYTQVLDDQGKVIATLGTDTPAPDNPLISVSRYQYRNLLTLPERIAIDNYAANPSLTDQQKATLATLHYDFQVAETIDLTNPYTIQGTQLLEAYGLIAPGRAAQILAGALPG